MKARASSQKKQPIEGYCFNTTIIGESSEKTCKTLARCLTVMGGPERKEALPYGQASAKE
jgi:hypothetical protein